MRRPHNRSARRLVILLAFLLPAEPIAAQRRLSASADAGIESGRGRGGDYDNRDLQGVRLSASVRLAAPRVGVFVEVSKESLGSLFGEKAICRVGSNGQCVPWYPYLRGWSTAAGLFVRPLHAVEARLGAGPARYTTNDQASGRLNAIVGVVDLAVYPVSHVGLAVVGQHIALSRYHGDRLTIRPLTIGLRLR